MKTCLGIFAVLVLAGLFIAPVQPVDNQQSTVCHVVYVDGIPKTYCTGDGPTSGSGGTDQTGLIAHAIIVNPPPPPPPDCMYTGRQCTSGGQLPPLAAVPTPIPCKDRDCGVGGTQGSGGTQPPVIAESIIIVPNPTPSPTPDCGNRGTCGIDTPGGNPGLE